MRVVNAAEKHVIVADEGLRSLDEADVELADVLYLNVSFNILGRLEGVEQARGLQVLDVSHNALKSLHETEALCHLRVLKCSYNEIAGLGWATALVNLQQLWVHENRIESPELVHLRALSKLTWLVIHPNPCTQCEDYAVAVVKQLPWLKRVDCTVVDQALRDRAEQWKAEAEPEIDTTTPTTPDESSGPESAAEQMSPPRSPLAPPAAPAPPAPQTMKKMTAEEFLRNFPVQHFIPVECNSTSSDSNTESEATHDSPTRVNSESAALAFESHEPAAHAAVVEDAQPPAQASPVKPQSPTKHSPRKVPPAKTSKTDVPTTKLNEPASASDGGVSSILGAVLSLPTFGADSFLKKQPVIKPRLPKKPKAAPVSTAPDTAVDDNLEQEPLTMMYPNSTVAAVTIRSDGSVVAKWPAGTVAVSVDKEPGGFRIYAAHKDGTIALSFDPAGVGFVNYYPSGRMLISTSSSGDGLYFSSDGFAILRQWDANGAMRDDKFEATDSLGDEPDGALLCKLSDHIAVRVQLVPRSPEAPRNPVAVSVYFATTSGIRRVFANRANAVGATLATDECDSIFGKELPAKSSGKADAAPPPVAHSDLLGDIRAAVAGL